MTHEYFKELMENSIRFDKEKINEFLDGLFENPLLLKWFKMWQTGKQKLVWDEIRKDNEKFQLEKDQSFQPKDFNVPRIRNNFNSKKAEYLFQLERKNLEKIKSKLSSL